MSVLADIFTLVAADAGAEVIEEELQALVKQVARGAIQVAGVDTVLFRIAGKISAAEVKLANAQTTLDTIKTEEGRADDIPVQENIVSSLVDESNNEQTNFMKMAKLLMKGRIVESKAMAAGSVGTAEKVEVPSSEIQSPTKQRRLSYAGSTSSPSVRDKVTLVGGSTDFPSEISFDACTTTTRNNSITGRVVSRSVGEMTKSKNENKVVVEILNHETKKAKLIGLGASNAHKLQQLQYDACYKITGFKVSVTEGEKAFMFYNSSTLRHVQLQEDELANCPAEDILELSYLKDTKGKANGDKMNIIVYTFEVMAKEKTNSDTAMKELREVIVVDSNNRKTLCSFLNLAADCVQLDRCYLIKAASVYNGELRVWGSASIFPCPDDLAFPLSGSYTDV